MPDPIEVNIHAAAFCGDFCGKCPNYLHTCAGCIPDHHQECYFVRCCQSKGIEHCGYCEDFPCQRLGTFVPDDRPECPPGYHIMNLRARLTMGTAAWLRQQRKMWADLVGN
jgi:hypothetical protein